MQVSLLHFVPTRETNGHRLRPPGLNHPTLPCSSRAAPAWTSSVSLGAGQGRGRAGRGGVRSREGGACASAHEVLCPPTAPQTPR